MVLYVFRIPLTLTPARASSLAPQQRRYPNRKSTVLLIKFGLLFYGVTRVAQLAILVALFCFYDLSDPMLSFGTKVFAIGGCSILMVMPKDYIFRIKASHSSVTPHLYFESKTVRAN